MSSITFSLFENHGTKSASNIVQLLRPCQVHAFPFVLVEKPAVVPLRLGPESSREARKRYLMAPPSKKPKVAALFGQARRKQPVSRAQALNLFLVHPSSPAHCPAGAAGV